MSELETVVQGLVERLRGERRLPARFRHGALGVWAKGGLRWLAPQELDVIQVALQAPGREAVQQLGQLFERYASRTG